MLKLTQGQKAKANAELEKLSSNGLQLLASFQRDIEDPSKSLIKVIASSMMSRFSTNFLCTAKGWLAAQNASDADIRCIVNIIHYTGAWGRWPVSGI